jgi:hypothetical protein
MVKAMCFVAKPPAWPAKCSRLAVSLCLPDASILACGSADRAGGKSVLLGHFKNCKPLKLKLLRFHGVKDESEESQTCFGQE